MYSIKYFNEFFYRNCSIFNIQAIVDSAFCRRSRSQGWLFFIFFLLLQSVIAQTNEIKLKAGNFNPRLAGIYSSKSPSIAKKGDAEDLFPDRFPLDKQKCKEEVEKRTYNSRSFVSNTGEIVVQNSLNAINYIDKSNQWQVISAKLSTSANGWAAVRQEFPTYLNQDGSTEISLGYERLKFNSHCKINNNEINLNDYTVGVNGLLAKDVVSSIDKKIVFEENRIETDYIINHPLAINNQDLVISEEIVIPENYTFKKNNDSKLPTIDTDEYVIYSPDNKIVARFHTPVYFDSKKKFGSATYSVKLENNKTILQITIPAAWLNAPERVYPITIDPLVTGPDTMYPPIYMGSCELPNFNHDSIQITIPANITITAFIVTDSYFADETQPPVSMGDGHIYLTTPCASTPVYSVGGTVADTAGYGYLDSADLKSILACCFAPSCNVQTFYLAHYLARTNWGAPGCTYMLSPPFNYIYYTPMSPWPFNAFMVGHTIETSQNQWYVYPSPICSDSCHVKLRLTTNYGVPPYTITHPWFVGSDTYGTWGAGVCTSTGKDTIDLTIPGCPTYCGNVTTLSVPAPSVVDVCGNSVAGLSAKNITVNPVPDATANNITVCTGTPISIQLNSCVGSATFNWSGSNGTNGATSTITDNVTNTGSSPVIITYTVTPTATNCQGTAATVTATVTPQPIALITPTGSTNICSGQSVTLTASGGTIYQWSGGSSANTATITVSPTITTTYSVQAISGTCADTYSMTVNVSNIPTVTRDTQYICSGKSITLTAFPATAYQWSGGATSTSQSITVAPTVSTYYYEVGTNSCGTFYDTVLVVVYPNPTINIINNDTIIQSGIVVPLFATGGATYEWSYASLSCYYCPYPIASPNVTTTFTVTGTDTNQCVSSDHVTIVVLNGGNELYIPNAFSPNGDGINDVFLAYGTNIKTIKMQIFNKWGELIYESDDKTKGWNGKYEDQFVQMDVYVYRIECEWIDGNTRKRIGNISLIK